MKSFNVITGLPRSGSTLICNILNQNPEFYASSTSPVPQMCATLSHYWSNSPELNSMLIHNKEHTEVRMLNSLRALVHAWYADKETVFDKSRGWANNSLLLNQLFPDAQIIVMVRDLRSIFGSIEKQHQKLPVLDHAMVPIGKTLYTRADQMFSPDGMIGGPLFAIEDMIRRKPRNVTFVQYEAFAQTPKKVMEFIYSSLDMDSFEHDFDDVANVAEDVDELYLGKFEHKGCGKVEMVDPDEWRNFVSPDIGELIMRRYPFFNQTFGYDRPMETINGGPKNNRSKKKRANGSAKPHRAKRSKRRASRASA